MSDAEDRLVGHALRELLRSDPTLVDPELALDDTLDEDHSTLPLRVREAWCAGERRVAPRLVRSSPGVERLRVLDPRPVDRRGRAGGLPRWLLPLSVAASLAVAAVGAHLATRGGQGAVPAGGAVTVADLMGSTQRYAHGSPLRIDAEGTTMEPNAALVSFLASGSVRLHDGELDVIVREAAADGRTAPPAVVIELPGGGALDVEPGSHVHLSVRAVAPPSSLEDVRLWASAQADLGVGVIEIDTRRGRARLSAAGGELAIFAAKEGARDEPALFLFRGRTLRAPEPIEEDIHLAIERVGADAWLPGQRVESMLNSYREGALAVLRRTPELWPLAEEAIAIRLGLTTPRTLTNGLAEGGHVADPDYVRRGWLAALAVDASPVALRLVRQAWRRTPEVFTGQTIATLAERGVPEFEREVDVWFDHWAAGTSTSTSLGAPFDAGPIAAVLALQGDARGIEVLRRLVGDDATDPKEQPSSNQLVAAIGLSRLGDGASLAAWLDQLTEQARVALERDDRETASSVVDRMTYAVALRDGTSLELALEQWDSAGAAPWAELGGPIRTGGSRHGARSCLEEPLIADLDHWLEAYHRLREQQRSGARGGGASGVSIEDELARLGER